MEDEKDAQAEPKQEVEPQDQGHDVEENAQEEPKKKQVTEPAAPARDYEAELAAKDAELADVKLGYELQLADARNVKAAKALLGEHKGDIAALKAAEPWLFQAYAPQDDEPKGATGLSNAGAVTDEGETCKQKLDSLYSQVQKRVNEILS